jgi:superkiller protein 3
MSQFIQSFSQMPKTPTTDGLLAPFFSLERYIHQLPRDASALHLAALLSERLGILEGAASFARRCTEVLEQAYEQQEDSSTARKFAIASTTLGRILVANGEHDDAISAFEGVLGLVSREEIPDGEDEKEKKTVIVLRAQALFGSGLAQFMIGNLEAALSSFETALEETPSSMTDIKGQITVLLAQTLWGLGSEESRDTAKSLLLD